MFREDWETEWLDSGGTGGGQAIKQSIGWKWNKETGKREFTPSTTSRREAEGTNVKEWNLQQEGYADKANRTLFDMEALHLGQEFDMLPLPGNMAPSQIALDPRNSRIYVRYINLLQRDALWDNFEIDIERLLTDAQIPLEGFFGVHEEPDGSKQTWGLHSGPTSSNEEHRKAWYGVMRKVTRDMLSYNGKISLVFQTYQTLDMPNEWSKALGRLSAVVRKEFNPGASETNPLYQGDWVTIHKYSNNMTQAIRKHPKRTGLTNPNGFRSPLGAPDRRFSINELRNGVSSRICERSPEKDVELGYPPTGRNEGRVHWGTDFGTGKQEGWKVYACRPGRVTGVNYGSVDASKVVWKSFRETDGKISQIEGGKLYEAWLRTMTDALGASSVAKSKKVVSLAGTALQQYQKFGTIIQDVTYPEIYYFTDLTSEGGNWIRIEHNTGGEPGVGSCDGDISVYMHLREIFVKVGDIIGGAEGNPGHDIDQPIGIVGQTSTLSPKYIDWFVKNKTRGAQRGGPAAGRHADWEKGKFQQLKPFEYQEIVSELRQSGIPDRKNKGGFTLPIHLHFEYWEKEGNGAPLDRSVDPYVFKDFSNTPMVKEGYVMVDPVPSFEAGSQGMEGKENYVLWIDNTAAIAKISAAIVAKEIKKDNGESYEVDTAKLEDMIEKMEELSSQGWYHYEGAMKLPNVWYKTWILNYRHGNKDELRDPNVLQNFFNSTDSAYTDLSTVFTGVSGGFTNIVARIPILSYEYPTLQHLGSIEPHYTFEFTLLDDRFDEEGGKGLHGIPSSGQLLEGMRSILQRNARKYREVKDSWSLATDTFMTRLLGSFRVRDAIFNNTTTGVVNQVTLLKRTIIERSDNGTVEGSPGLSYLSFEMSETNPYDEEEFVNINPAFFDVETARKEALQALYKLDIAGEFKDSVLPILIGSLANRNILDPNNEEGYGQFSVDSTSDLAYALGGSQKVILYRGDDPEFKKGLGFQDSFVIQDPGGVYERLLRNELEGDFDKSVTIRNGLLLVNANEGDYGEPEFSTPYIAEDYGTFDEGAVSNETRKPRASFDISRILESSSDLAQLSKLNLPKIADYWQLLDAVLKSAEISLAEEKTLVSPRSSLSYQTGGLSKERVQAELYDLPVTPSMWRLWQYYQIAAGAKWIVTANKVPSAGWKTDILLGPVEKMFFASVTQENEFDATGEAAFTVLKSNAGWLTWSEVTSEALSPELLKKATDTHLSFGTDILTFGGIGLDSLGVGATLIIDQGRDGWAQVTGAKKAEDTKWMGTFLRGGTLAAEEKLTEIYLRHMYPSNAVWLTDLAKYYAKDTLFSPIVALINGNEGPLASVHAQLQENLHSCGYWSFGFSDSAIGKAFGAGYPRFTVRKEDFKTTADGLLYYDNTSGERTPSGVSGIKDYDSSFIWPVSEDVEIKKLREFKSALARLADDILSDPKILTALGLQRYINILASQKTIKGTECYPDLQLPEHPYYGDTKDVSPDFYFWNMYDDGQAFAPEVIERIRTSADHIVSNCYESLRVMQGRNDKANEMPYTNTSISDQQIITPFRYNAEATDGNSPNPSNVGPTDIPWYENDAAADAVAKFNGTIKTAGEKSIKDANQVSATPRRALKVNKAEISAINPPSASMSVTEGQIDTGDSKNFKGGLHYPMRVTPEKYTELRNHLLSSRPMFGNKAAYLGKQFEENAPAPEVAQVRGTALQTPLQYTHLFDESSLKQLAFDSSRDIVSQKVTMRRAFPTFKLFFIEEDEIEDHLIAYDDFHSYNAVKEFSVVQSRKIAADVAIITLQNVSGTLDATRRDAIADVDYFTKKPKSKDKNQSTTSGEAVAEGTDNEQPFQAVLLRPGMNIQLRSGYSNDPRNLHVMISGRVVDITWNKVGDMAEIMVQGFGVELQQAYKGTEGDGTIYYTTHHLLGAMMLQPELVHFGRWERGQLFQEGESQDSRLDFYDYSREGFMGRFSMTTAITSWLAAHPIITIVGMLGLGALNLYTPGAGKLTAGAAKPGFLSRVFSSLARVGEKPTVLKATEYATTGAFRKILPEAIEAELKTAGGWKGLSDASKIAVVKLILGKQREAYRLLKSTSSWTLAHSKEATRLRKITHEAIAKAETIEDVLAAGASHVRGLNYTLLKGGMLGNPAYSLLTSPLGFLGWHQVKTMSSFGIRSYLVGTGKVAGGALLTGLVLDALGVPIRAAYDATAGRIQRWFSTAQVSLMISPQDDNLFCPHPKDYMDMSEKSYTQVFEEWLTVSAGDLVAGTNQGYKFSRWLHLETIFDKRVLPQSCQYQIDTSTIWDIFHEMSLRHPGWIYGVRPYGHAFRNTMFFGVPSQRYWSKPASNEFIQRVNTLSRFLANDEIDETEYELLYGDNIDGKTIAEYKEQLTFSARLKLQTHSSESPPVGVVYGPQTKAEAELNPPPAYDPRVEKEVQAQLKARLSAPAIKEYLRGLELRFVPFRNHHMVSSTRDLIWNGIMSSENAAYNAVSVTYFDETSGASKSSETTTEIFKAHSFIPEHMVRVLPLPVYRNCISYPMAIRYAMGTLMDTMKDMYRGEIIVTGNPRLRPYDICILTDDYNDMVGPIEIEQVVHTFSHETGFITEIKPSAVVIANEISSWPLIEAAKLWTLAVRDIEAKYAIGPGQTGLMGDIASVLASTLSEADSKTLEKKYQTMYGGEIPFIQDLAEDKALSESLEAWDKDIALAVAGMRTASVGILGGTAAAAALVGAGIAARVPGGRILGSIGLLGAVPLALTAGALHIALQTPPSLKMLIGGTVLFAQMAREESIILVPLMKNGQPIVSGLNIQDPSMMWTHFKGNLRRMVSDITEGTEDLMRVWDEHKTGAWDKIWEAYDDSGKMDPKTRVVNTNLTGEE
jgi:murein DD-endopeptidase MepM/ murein hydrolase activator NlpD